MIRNSILNLALAAVALSFAPPAQAAWPPSPFTGGLALATSVNHQVDPSILSDGAGGQFVAWTMSQNAGVYLQRVSGDGVAQWGAGATVSRTEGGHTALVSDDAGGVIVVWEDYRLAGKSILYAQRFNAAGAPQWTADGLPLMTFGAGGSLPVASKARVIADGAGGAIVCWQQLSIFHAVEGPSSSRVNRINSLGARQWGTNGVAVTALTGESWDPDIASDGIGGAFVTWSEFRSPSWRVYAQHYNSLGAAQWTANGVQAAYAGATSIGQFEPSIAADGAGGVLLSWSDSRNEGGSYTDIYGQRLTSGAIGLWGTGILVCTAGNSQYQSRILADGTGGAFIVWNDQRPGATGTYAQRVLDLGSVAWAANGLALDASTAFTDRARLASDGAGGIFATWTSYQDVTGDVAGRRVTPAGALVPATSEILVSAASNGQTNAVLSPDGTGAVVVAWQDFRGPKLAIYAQRVDAYGYLGFARSTITQVRDVANDQGGKVKLSWNASAADNTENWFGNYEVFQRVLSGPWTLINSVGAGPLAQYSLTLPTASDSGASNVYTQYFVRYHAGSSPTDPFWDSLPDSGYSVDNLAPIAPAQLQGTYEAGVTQLSWSSGFEADLAGYRVYRAAFVEAPLSSAQLIGTPSEPSFNDAAGAAWVYLVTSVDRHGNESSAARFVPAVALGAGTGGAVWATRLYGAQPNPVRATAELAFDLARDADVLLQVFDAQGRVVATPASGHWAAGAHRVTWQGATTAPGIYLVRLAALGVVQTERVVKMR